MVDLSQLPPPSQTTNILWNICSPHPNLQFSNCVQFCFQETKDKNWLFHRKTLAKDLNGSINLSLENTKPVLALCVSIFIQAGGYSHKCVLRASAFKPLSWKLVCDQGNYSFVLWQGWC